MSKAPIQELNLDDLLGQTERWVDAQGNEVFIDMMSIEHRRNAAGWLLKRAPWLALTTLHHEDSVLDVFELVSNPYVWIKNTPLYQRLIEGGAEPVRRAAA